MTTKLGRTSLRILFSLISIICASAASHAADCTLVKVAEVPVVATEAGLAFDVLVNGRPVKASLGGGVNAAATMTEDLAKSLGLDANPTFVTQPGLQIRIGKAEIENVSLLLNDPNATLSPDHPFQVGPELFANFDLEIDLSKQRLALFKTDHCPRQAVYWAKEWFEMPYETKRVSAPIVAVQVNDNQIDAEIHLSAYHTNISDSGAWKVGVSRTNGHEAILDTLEFGGIRLRHVTVGQLVLRSKDPISGELSRTDAKSIGYTDMTIGQDILRKLRLYVSRKEKLIYFTLASG